MGEPGSWPGVEGMRGHPLRDSPPVGGAVPPQRPRWLVVAVIPTQRPSSPRPPVPPFPCPPASCPWGGGEGRCRSILDPPSVGGALSVFPITVPRSHRRRPAFPSVGPPAPRPPSWAVVLPVSCRPSLALTRNLLHALERERGVGRHRVLCPPFLAVIMPASLGLTLKFLPGSSIVWGGGGGWVPSSSLAFLGCCSACVTDSLSP